MKKILDIINIPEANECYSLETDYKIERKNLKRYLESLKLFKVRVSQSTSNLQCIAKNLMKMHQNQSKSRKKTSEVDYYMYNGIKVFDAMLSVFDKSSQFYEDLSKRICNLEVRVTKCLADQKKKYEKNFEQHEREIKLFASQCYPDTTTILFMIGFMAPNKIQKKGDSFRQNTIIEESKRYSNFLNQCLNEMEELKNETMDISKNYYEGAKDMWIKEVDQFKETLEAFEIDEEEVNKIADQTGRVLTDRSSKSNEDLSQDQEGNIAASTFHHEAPEEVQDPEQMHEQLPTQ